MGVLIPKVELFLRLNDIHPLGGDIMQLGKQDIFVKRSEINLLYRNRGGAHFRYFRRLYV